MKNILKTTIFTFLLISFVSCTNDKAPVAVRNGFELRDASESAPPSVLLQENESQTFIDLDWDSANYGVPTGNTGTKGLVYNIIVKDKDNPSSDILVKSEVPRTITDSTLTVKQFNTLLSRLPTFKCTAMNVEITIESVLGNVPGNQLTQLSTPIELTVTGYSTQSKILAFVKEGSLPATAPKIISSSSQNINDFEGYIYLDAGNYKLYKPDACQDFTNPTIYGVGGTLGSLSSETNATNIVIVTAGHYLVKANLSNNTYTVSPFTTFGIFGMATRSGLGTGFQVPFEYDAVSKTWFKEIDLIRGRKFKFKSNLWTGVLVVPVSPNPPYAPGTASSSVSILGKTSIPLSLEENNTAGQGDITVPGTDDGNRDKYKIVLDVSKPRNYTYKLTLMPN